MSGITGRRTDVMVGLVSVPPPPPCAVQGCLTPATLGPRKTQQHQHNHAILAAARISARAGSRALLVAAVCNPPPIPTSELRPNMAALAPAAGRMLGTPASEGLAAARPRASLMGTKVPSMLFELEMEEAGGEEASSEHTLSAVAACRRTILGSLTPASAQVAAVVEAALAGSTTGQQQQQQAGDPCSRLAEALVAAGYETCLRQTVGGGAGGQCLRNLTHSFLICSPGRHSSAAELCVIVDPSFRDQFSIAHPTPRYTAVLAALPAVLICQADRIQPLVELLCGEMCLAFQGMGIVLPPWRYAKSMLSKWLPRRGSVDLTFGPSGAAAISSAAAAVAARRRSSPGDPSQGSGGSSASCLTTTNNNSGSSGSANSDSGSRKRGRHGAALPRLLAGGGSNVATSRAIAVAPPCNTSGNGCSTQFEHGCAQPSWVMAGL